MTPDQRLRSTARNLDHEDPGASLAALSARSRVEGPDVWLEALADLSSWDAWEKAAPEAQDAAAQVVAGRLGAEWELKGMRVWSCPSTRAKTLRPNPMCGWCHGTGIMGDHLAALECGCSIDDTETATISHRLGLFRHRPTGMEFSLIPGVAAKPCPSCGGVYSHRYVSRSSALNTYMAECPGSSFGSDLLSIAPLLVGRWPVTWGHRGFPESDPRYGLPLTGMSHAAASFHLSNSLPGGLRLPSSPEWEHACRAGSTTRFPWGDDFEPEGHKHCWHAGNSGDRNQRLGRVINVVERGGLDDRRISALIEAEMNSPLELVCVDPDTGLITMRDRSAPRPHAPSEHDAQGRWNAFGLVDMIGNVWEWLSDQGGAGGSFRSSPSRDFGFIVDRDRFRSMDNDMGDVGFRAFCSIPGLEARS